MVDVLSQFYKILNKHNGIRELSRKSGIAASTISRIKNKKVTPDLSTIITLLNSLNYEILIKPKQ